MTATRSIGSRNVFGAYYAATALFLLLDYGLRINVRLAFLESFPGWRGLYYGSCFLCLAIILWRPAWTAIVAAFESLVTLVALILNMALRSMLVTDQMLESGTGFVTTPEIINFVISGGVAYLAWFHGIRALQRP